MLHGKDVHITVQQQEMMTNYHLENFKQGGTSLDKTILFEIVGHSKS